MIEEIWLRAGIFQSVWPFADQFDQQFFDVVMVFRDGGADIVIALAVDLEAHAHLRLATLKLFDRRQVDFALVIDPQAVVIGVVIARGKAGPKVQ